MKGGGIKLVQVTYQKRDGTIMQRFRKTTIPYEIGETTSMGWKVLNVEYEYKGKYYTYYDYNMKIREDIQRYTKRKQIIELYLKKTKSLLYYILLGFLILYYIKIRL